MALPLRAEQGYHIAGGCCARSYSVPAGVLVLGLLPVFLTYGYLDGLLQRVLGGLIFLWMEVFMIRLFLVSSAGS